MEEIRRALKDVIYALYGVDVEAELTMAPEGTGADYASNVAMKLAKLVHQSPMVIAEAMKAKLEEGKAETDSGVKQWKIPETVEVAAPGFLNFRMGDAYFEAIVGNLAERVELGVGDYRGKVVVTEFSDPNPFKVLHVGHLYTSIVGDSISRLLELAGAKVVRVNFGGDVGLHVAKTLWAYDESSKRATLSNRPVRRSSTKSTTPLRASDSPRISSSITSSSDGDAQDATPLRTADSSCGLSSVTSSSGDDAKDTTPLRGSDFPRISSSITSSSGDDAQDATLLRTADSSCGSSSVQIDALTVEELARCYVEGTRAYDEDEKARREIVALNKEIYRVNAGDLHGERIWDLYWRGRELSYQYFDEFYEKIGVKFDKYYPESSVAGRGLEEVRAHTGSVYEESEGAVVYHGENVGLHTRVFINREGVPTYETKDVGLIFTKWDDWHFDESVVVTGNEQTEYMKVVLASVSEYAPELTERTRHLTHGLVKLAGNVKMSSRKGNFLKAVDVLELVEGMLSEALRGKSGEDCEDIASLADGGEKGVDWDMVLAAVKYAFLKYKMGGDIIFDPKESVSTVGNSGIYILYAIVRAKKILRKAEKAGAAGGGKAVRATEKTDYEWGLCKKMAQYVEVIREAVAEKAPNKICTYLYELAQTFSRFYEHVQVVGSEDEAELLKVVRAYLNVMMHGVALLGIEVPEEM